MRCRLVHVIDELMLPWIRVSDLRRCYAVRCLENGMSYRDLTKNLGLTDVKDVKAYYAGFLAPDIRQAREKEYQDAFPPKKRPEHIDHVGPDLTPEVAARRGVGGQGKGTGGGPEIAAIFFSVKPRIIANYFVISCRYDGECEYDLG